MEAKGRQHHAPQSSLRLRLRFVTVVGVVAVLACVAASLLTPVLCDGIPLTVGRGTGRDKPLRGGGGGKQCLYTCPRSGMRIGARSGHVPSSNGCGAMGMMASSAFDFTPCCDEHDKCYDTCGQLRSECDDKFQACMAALCAKQYSTKKQECANTANIYHMGTTAFGCSAFLASQAQACECTAEEL
eukprot:TRINITY_DN10477_c0_g1_i1.p1 TRINITY_DN10477_c0_g1~~TRINITY_DN10477_c0_g1_i1.p1  ORF type:complete len:186 (+),score=19.08 TRINITY_DN10477_c0_g1_i1:1-558(+)